MSFAGEVLELLNGQLYLDNEAGETELDVQSYTVPIRTTTPDSAIADLFLDDMNNPLSNVRANIAFTEIQMSTFLTDQVTYLREICNI